MSEVYFIAAPTVGMIKIGKATSVTSRLLALQSSSPVVLEIVATISCSENHESLLVEQRLHIRHDASRSHGEWFVYSDAIKADVAAITDGKFNYRDIPDAPPPAGGYRAKWLERRTNAIRAGKAAASSRRTAGGAT